MLYVQLANFLHSKLFQVRVHPHSELCEGTIFSCFQCLLIEPPQSTISLIHLPIFYTKCISSIGMNTPENRILLANMYSYFKVAYVAT